MAELISGATLSEALKLCNDGYPIRRQAWGRGITISLLKGLIPQHVTDDFIEGVPRSLFEVAGGGLKMPTLVCIVANGSRREGWTPDAVDMLAADWLAMDQPVVNEPSADWPHV